MSTRLTSLAMATLALSTAAFTPSADALTITHGFSGLWTDNARPLRAFSTEVVQGADGKELHAFWYTYDRTGKPMLVKAKGPISGASAHLTGVFAASSTAPAGAARPWGELSVTFSDCAHGDIAFVPIDRSQPRGQAAITRAAAGAHCTGGIADDRIAGADSRIVQYFTNTGAVPLADGKARFEERSDRTDFKVEAEDLPIGSYSLRVGGVERATLELATAAIGTRGEVEFRSPVEPGKILLDFDPRGQLVEIAQGSKVFLTTTLGSEPAPDDSPGGAGEGTIERYVLEIETANDGPELKAELEDRSNRADFSVELEDFLPGSYTLQVDGIERGAIDVVAVPGGTEGEIEFRDPPEPGHFMLDFDPRGQSLQILQDGAVLISGLFPDEPTDGSDDNGGGGNDDPPGDDNGGGGNDDPPGDDNGGGGNDDPPGDDNGGGGNDDPPGDDNGGGGNDDPPGDDNGGGGNDDPPGDDDHGGHGGDDDDDGDDDRGGDDHGGGHD